MSIVNDELLGGFDESRYPGEFLKRYEPLECLARDAQCETFYVKDKLSGGFAVAKCYTNTAQTSRFDKNSVLNNLSHEGIPRFLGEYATDAMLCTVREYVPGAALDAWACENHVSEGQALDVMIQLCDILTYLHTQSPPVIHRDIKPGNIIITDDGRVKLIDFGISRVYNENTTTDTVFFGTQEFAPPEQYGFSQTSARADIFSSGVLLGYLLTGKTDHKAVLSRCKNKALLHIYKNARIRSLCSLRNGRENERALLRAAAAKKVLQCQFRIVSELDISLAGLLSAAKPTFRPLFCRPAALRLKNR
jgi:serine/threonine protein kinase